MWEREGSSGPETRMLCLEAQERCIPADPRARRAQRSEVKRSRSPEVGTQGGTEPCGGGKLSAHVLIVIEEVRTS